MTDDTASPDLSTVTTDELVAELKARSDAFVVGYLPKAKPDGGAHYEWHGNFAACVGMVTVIQHDMLHDTDGPEEDDDD